MKVFIINLERSIERRLQMQKVLGPLDIEYEFFEAVDGSKLPSTDLESYIDPTHEYPKPFSPGEIGCFLSHYSVYKEIIKQNLPFALILEDDIVVSPGLPGLLKQLKSVIKDGEVISLYSSFPKECHLYTEGSVGGYKLIKPLPGELVVGNVAYIITNSVAGKMVDALLPINNVIDDWQYWVRRGLVEDFKIVFPHPVDLSDNYSDIHESKGGIMLQLKKIIVNKQVPLFSNLIINKRKQERWQARREKIVIDSKHPDLIFH